MNNKDWSIRHAIFDMIDTNLMEVPNKKQMMNFIKEDISEEDLFKLYDMMTHEDLLIQSSQFLKECYYNHLKENSDLPIFNVPDILNKRDIILTEAEEEKLPRGLTAEDIGLLIKKYGVYSAGIYLATKYATLTKEQKEDLKRAVRAASKRYDEQISSTFFKHILPKSRIIRTAVTKPLTHGPGLIMKHMWRKSKKDLPSEFKKFKSLHPGIKILGKFAAAGLTITGAIAASYLSYKNYMENKKARQFCTKFKGKQNTICMLKFKIAASDEAIDKLQEAKSGCSQKSDPEKCTYSMNREIWKWQRRKQKYLLKLKQLTGEAAKEQREKPVGKKESPF